MLDRRNYIVVLLLMFAWCDNLCAQANSDYKTVARKKIKVATSWKITNEGDTIAYLRYSYDVTGRLIKIEELDRYEEYYQAYYYDSLGNDIGGLGLSPSPGIKRDSVIPNDHRLAGWSTVGFDTSNYMQMRYDESGNMIYSNSRAFLKGAVRSSRLQFTKGDTTFVFVSDSVSARRHVEFTIQNRKLLGQKGYSTTTYRINKTDTAYFGYNIFINNRRGHVIKMYVDIGVLYGTKRGPNGTLYRPESDTSFTPTLYYTFNNQYSWNGRLRRTIKHSVTKKEPDVVTTFSTKRLREFNSIEMLDATGSVVYEYY
jgi:hypothetical protein